MRLQCDVESANIRKLRALARAQHRPELRHQASHLLNLKIEEDYAAQGLDDADEDDDLELLSTQADAERDTEIERRGVEWGLINAAAEERAIRDGEAS